MVGKIKYKLLTWLINDLCRKDETIVASMDERLKLYQSVVDIYKRAAQTWFKQ